MENKSARIKLNLTSREIEIEGSEEFIKNYEALIAEYANIIKSASGFHRADNNKPAGIVNEEQQNMSFASFGEFLTKFSKSIKDVDKILVAGYYIQISNESKSFSTRDASGLLIQQNIKLTNPSAFIKLNLESRKIFKLNSREFRVSDIGIGYIESLKEDNNQ